MRVKEKHVGLAVLLMLAAAAGFSIVPAHSADTTRGIHRDPLRATTQSGESLSLYGGSHALLIGVSRYESWPTLSSIPQELAALEAVLDEQGFSVETLLDPDTQALWSGVQSFIRRHGYKHDNRLLIFFAGHGHSQGDKGFLLPANVPLPESPEFRANALPMTQVMAWARDMEAKHALFLFDSCFSGTVFKSRNLPSAARRYIRTATSRPVRQFLTAGSADEVVPAKSTFTPALMDAIRGDGDLNGDGYVTGSELGVHLSQLLPQHVPQTPQYGTIQDYGLSRGDFVFFPRSDKAEDEPVSVPEPKPSISHGPDAESDAVAIVDGNTMEALLWRSAEQDNTRESYQAYLERFPEGIFSRIATSRLDRMVSSDFADIVSMDTSGGVTVVEEEGQLSEQALLATWQSAERSLGLSRDDRRGVQVALNEAGIDVGAADGLWGPRTRDGLKKWQESLKLEATGYLDEENYRLIVAELSVLPVQVSSTQQTPEPTRRSFEPEMVRIERGRFEMGTRSGGWESERPVHQVSVKSFELGRYEVTVREWREFVERSGYRTDAERDVGEKGCYSETSQKGKFGWVGGRSWKDPGFVQGEDHPVVCVSWRDAKAYVEWLSKETGKEYRLASEAEWEYAARAGSKSNYHFGDEESRLCEYGNVADETAKKTYGGWTIAECTDGYVYTSPIGAFIENGNGLRDMHGNVWEWVEDCWHESYEGAPVDGSAWTQGGECGRRVQRGGSWGYGQDGLRSADRGWNSTSNRVLNLGFRVSRTLAP